MSNTQGDVISSSIPEFYISYIASCCICHSVSCYILHHELITSSYNMFEIVLVVLAAERPIEI